MRHTENSRTAVMSCVNELVTVQSEKINKLHKALDLIGQRALQSAEKARAALTAHIEMTDRLDDEIQRMQDAVADLVESSREQ
jgi:hypothetical protein